MGEELAAVTRDPHRPVAHGWTPAPREAPAASDVARNQPNASSTRPLASSYRPPSMASPPPVRWWLARRAGTRPCDAQPEALANVPLRAAGGPSARRPAGRIRAREAPRVEARAGVKPSRSLPKRSSRRALAASPASGARRLRESATVACSPGCLGPSRDRGGSRARLRYSRRRSRARAGAARVSSGPATRSPPCRGGASSPRTWRCTRPSASREPGARSEGRAPAGPDDREIDTSGCDARLLAVEGIEARRCRRRPGVFARARRA